MKKRPNSSFLNNNLFDIGHEESFQTNKRDGRMDGEWFCRLLAGDGGWVNAFGIDCVVREALVRKEREYCVVVFRRVRGFGNIKS